MSRGLGDVYKRQDLINVSVCQFSGPCSDGVSVPKGLKEGYYGRGYSAGTPENGTVRRILEGKNFQEQWESAIQADPQMIFVTGWNEWIALKLSDSSDRYFMVDQFDYEYSRDLEPMKGGYGDNYYMQTIQNIRKWKYSEAKHYKYEQKTCLLYTSPSPRDTR